MVTQSTHRFWLKIAAIVIGAFGPVLTLSTLPGFTEPARLVLDLLTWPVDGFPTYAPAEMRFLSALTGGFLMGWGVTIWMLSVHVYDHAPEGVRKAFLSGALAWFVFDSTGSIVSGHWPNLFWNLLFLVIAVGPLWTPASDTPQA